MMQEIVVKVSMTCEECRSKALQTVSKIKGVISAAIEGPERDRVVVVGNDIDIVRLLNELRKKVGDANIDTVNVVGNQTAVPQNSPLYQLYLFLYNLVRDYDLPCTIM